MLIKAFVLVLFHVSVRLEAVQQLTVETESEDSVLVRWRGVSGAQAYRLVWGPFTGQEETNIKHAFLTFFPLQNAIFYFLLKGRNVETVEIPGERESHILSSLQPDTEYIVTVIPLYEGNTEGAVATARFQIGRRDS